MFLKLSIIDTCPEKLLFTKPQVEIEHTHTFEEKNISPMNPIISQILIAPL